MEIDTIAGNDEKVIVLDNYYVLGRDSNDGKIIEWKYDRRQPKLTLKAGNIAEAEENLMKMFKEGEYIVFNDLALKGGSLKK